jgi:hypothetical protein
VRISSSLGDAVLGRKLRNLFLARARQAHQERDGATVQVAGGSRERRVDAVSRPTNSFRRARCHYTLLAVLTWRTRWIAGGIWDGSHRL